MVMNSFAGLNPFFSIIIPTYNQAHFLPQALNSVLAQTDGDWEAVVVNDGSTDSTSEILEKYAQEDPRFHIIHKPNGGVAAALNDALRHVRGEWICWLSTDDFFELDKLEINRRWISQNPDCRFFYSFFNVMFEPTGKVKKKDLWGGRAPDRKWQILELFKRNYINGVSICIHRNSWQRVGIFDEYLLYGHDYDMWMKLLVEYPAVFIPKITCTNRQHNSRWSAPFQVAGLYDSAKAAILFVNNHPFTKYFPLLNLYDHDDLQKAIKKTFQTIENPNRFIYGLGVHPLVLFRMLEHISSLDMSSSDGRQTVKKLSVIFQNKAKKLARQYQGTPFGFYWKLGYVLARQLTQTPQSRFEYHAITPQQIGRENYQRTGFPPLKRYLEQFEGIDLKETEAELNFQDVLAITVVLEVPYAVRLDKPSKSLENILNAAKALSSSGYMVLLVGQSDQSFGYFGNILYLGMHDDIGKQEIFSWLGPVDVFISLDEKKHPLHGADIWSARSIYIAHDDLSTLDLNKFLQTLPTHSTQIPMALYHLGGKWDQFLYEIPIRLKRFYIRVQDGIERRLRRVGQTVIRLFTPRGNNV
jgi:glycosyltransferase involved in cell wall biosynthesis